MEQAVKCSFYLQSGKWKWKWVQSWQTLPRHSAKRERAKLWPLVCGSSKHCHDTGPQIVLLRFPKQNCKTQSQANGKSTKPPSITFKQNERLLLRPYGPYIWWSASEGSPTSPQSQSHAQRVRSGSARRWCLHSGGLCALPADGAVGHPGAVHCDTPVEAKVNECGQWVWGTGGADWRWDAPPCRRATSGEDQKGEGVSAAAI
jgi:hypothetical protein|mmetsp:Transcript_45998/g.77335  ORF Transcript_45998/g.77335 Transcript_45998/m.77335 type:complete len:203 (-) Transcript_45998:2533-3141(-)